MTQSATKKLLTKQTVHYVAMAPFVYTVYNAQQLYTCN